MSGAAHLATFAVAFLLFLLAPLAVDGQGSERIARIGMLRSEHRSLDDRIRQNLAEVRAGLQDEGLADGRHYRIDYHAPTSDVDAGALARMLVRERVDVIHAIGRVAIEAARKATTTIPILAHDYETDPIAAGFVRTLGKPGGNITGMFLDLPDITGKLLELLKTTLPGVRRIGVLWDPLTGRAQVLAVERAAKALAVDIGIIEVRAGSLERSVRSAADRGIGALLLLGSPLVSSEFPRIAAATTTARLPAISVFPAFARLGGLMAYGPDAADQYRQEGRMIAKIVKGTKPADLPVERPTKFYLVINLKTAKALGLTIPPSVLARADEVIQ